MATKLKSDIARATKAALRSSRPNERGLLIGDAESFEVAIGPGSVERTVAIVETLAELLREAGCAPTLERVDYRTKCLRLGGEAVRVRILEELDRTHHVPTREEQDRLKTPFPYPRVPAWDYRPTGRLTLTADAVQYGRSETWTDRPEARLEDSLPRIAKTIRKLVVDQRTRRTESEQRARVSAEQDRARYDAEALERKREEHRGALLAEARRWQEASLLRDYARELQIEAAALADLEGSKALGEFVESLLDASDRLDPVSTRLGAMVQVTQASRNDAEADTEQDTEESEDTCDPETMGDLSSK